MSIISVENLSKSYGSTSVLENLCFTVEKGDTLYIVGENGSGKTTLIKTLLGLEAPTSGRVVWGKGSCKIGYLPQRGSISPDFPATVREVVMSGFLNRSRSLPFYSAAQKQAANEIMARLSIADIASLSFRELSGGQRQRTLLCRAICAADGILLLDEPLTGLDPIACAEFYEITEDLSNSGMTLIIISHDISCAAKYGNKILHISKGDYFFGSSKEYIHSPQGEKMLSEGHHHA